MHRTMNNVEAHRSIDGERMNNDKRMGEMWIACNCNNGNSNHCVTMNCPHQSTVGCWTLLLISAFVQQMTGLCPSNGCLWHKEREKKGKKNTHREREKHSNSLDIYICARNSLSIFNMCRPKQPMVLRFVWPFIHFLCSAARHNATYHQSGSLNQFCRYEKKTTSLFFSLSLFSNWNFIVTQADAWLTLFCVLFNHTIWMVVY